MAEKTLEIIDVTKVTSLKVQDTGGTNWNQCVFCQTDTKESLICPSKNKSQTLYGYHTVATIIEDFNSINCLPKSISIARLDEGEGIEKTFQARQAMWHDSCRLKYNKTEFKRAQKRKLPKEDSTAMPLKYSRRSIASEGTKLSGRTCFFCNESTSSKDLRKASTLNLDLHVREAALLLEDTALLAKLSAGDLVAQDAEYHAHCLSALYNRARDKKSPANDQTVSSHGIALGKLVSFIDECRLDKSTAPVFKLADLVKQYENLLQEMGSDVSINSTVLKRRLMSHFPDMEELKSGVHILLVFQDDAGSAIRFASEHNADSEGICLARAASIVRRHMSNICAKFQGSFEPGCQEKSVPTSLVALVGMILNAPCVEPSQNSSAWTPTLTISQLLMFNSCARRRNVNETADSIRRSSNREPPLPVYLGALLHTKTRKRELVDILYHLGLSVSYNRVLDISTSLGSKTCRFYAKEGVVCPPKLKHGLFTTGAVDNIDHNPSATSAKESFHGTSISLFQHPTAEAEGTDRGVANDGSDEVCTQLPESYTLVPPVASVKSDPPLPILEGPNRTDGDCIPEAIQQEFR